MSEPLPTESEVAGANRDMRWPRLVANSFWVLISFAIGSFAVGLFAGVWNHTFKDDIVSLRVFWWLAKAVAVGLFFGFFMGFCTWLTQEIFGRSETKSSQRTGG